MEREYSRGLYWWPDLLDSLIQRVTTLYSSLLHTHTSSHSHVFTSRCFVEASNGGRSFSSGFPKCLQLQLPASHNNLIPSDNSLIHLTLLCPV
jgi:hypothetical protein